MPLLDAAAKLAAIVGVVGLGFAFCQYRHAVKLAKSNNRRASVELAARECAHYGTAFITQLEGLRAKIDKSGCEYLKHSKAVKEGLTLKLDNALVTAEDSEKMKEFWPEAARVLNLLEGFAIPFASGVADDDIGFMECGRSFVKVVEENLPLYSFVDLNHYYHSSKKVYGRWRQRIEKEELDRKYAQAGKEFFVLTAERLTREKSDSRFASVIAAQLKKLAERLDKPQA